jgi:hypothetical protein
MNDADLIRLLKNDSDLGLSELRRDIRASFAT